MLLLLQAAQIDPISNGAGWVGAGLLGLVLGWLLLVHLPAKDKQLKEVIDGKDKLLDGIIATKDKLLKDTIDSRDKQLNDILAKKWDMIQALTKDHKESVERVALHCEQEMGNITKYWQEQVSMLTRAIQDLGESVDREAAHDARRAPQ
jgi:hypothetical protein